jgi:hypothetical protein
MGEIRDDVPRGAQGACERVNARAAGLLFLSQSMFRMVRVAQAAAHAQKHSERRQQSESYDQERDTRLVKAAFDCALNCVGSEPTATNARPLSDMNKQRQMRSSPPVHPACAVNCSFAAKYPAPAIGRAEPPWPPVVRTDSPSRTVVAHIQYSHM